MAKKKWDEEDGVWRTIGGRRVFIRKGQSMADAMKSSGKFKIKAKESEAKEMTSTSELKSKLDQSYTKQGDDTFKKATPEKKSNELSESDRKKKIEELEKKKEENSTLKINELSKDNKLLMTYVKVKGQNTQYYGETFGQNLEPKGEYMSMDTLQGKNKIEGYEYGTIKFENPLIVDFKNTGSTGWKKDLSDKYNGLTGQKLSNAIKKDGYDAIITKDNDDFVEIVNLNGKKAPSNGDKSDFKNTGSAGSKKYPDWIENMSDNEPQRKYKNYLQDLASQKEKETGRRIFSINGTWHEMEKGDATTTKKIEAKDTKELAKKLYDLEKGKNYDVVEAYRKYKREHPNSKVTYNGFKKNMYK